MPSKKLQIARAAIEAVPEVIPFLSNRARYMLYKPTEYKTYDFMRQAIEGLVNGVYYGNIGGQFIDTMANIISGQLSQAYRQAYEDEGFTDLFLPDYLTESLEAMILNQFDFVDGYYRAIVDARVDGTPVAPLLARASLWANQWDVAYKEAVQLIRLKSGGNLEWKKGATEKGCRTCAALDGIIMSAQEWQALDLHPRGYPNSKLECEGGGPVNNCDCELVPTDKRRSPGGYGRVEEILLATA
jgi:hypothetical protein